MVGLFVFVGIILCFGIFSFIVIADSEKHPERYYPKIGNCPDCCKKYHLSSGPKMLSESGGSTYCICENCGQLYDNSWDY